MTHDSRVRTLQWRDLRKPAPLLAALVVVLIVVVALAFRWWDRYVEDGLGRWAVEELARRTGGTYRLVLGDLSFLPLAGTLAFDSATIVTDSARNRRRPVPLPVLRIGARQCRVSGLSVPRLLLRKSFAARELGCHRVVARIALTARSRPDPAAADTAAAATPLREFVRPLGISSFRVATVSFPSLSLALSRPGRRGDGSVVLDRARFDAEGLVFDLRTAVAHHARLGASGVLLRPDTLSELSAARLEADLTDSTLWLAGAKHEPAIPEDEWVKRVRVRRDRIRFELDSLHARGVAFRAFLTSGDIGIRRLQLLGARLDVLSDKRIPPARPRPRPTPQAVAARPGPPFRLDTLLITAGTIVYREWELRRERPGVVSFERLSATVLDLDLPSQGKPLRIDASARLMGEGVLSARATVPLDAADFRYQLAGKLEKMPARAFNRFLTENESFRFDNGSVEEITVRQTVRGGRAMTTVTPRYQDLSIEPTGEGGGVVGSVTRAVKDFVAGAFVVRSRNPDEDGKNLRIARTVRRYDRASPWTQFLWFGIRDGLVEVMKE
jgi:hypothetical protein